MSKNIFYYLGFSHFLGIGPVRLQALMKRFTNVKKAYQAPISSLKEILGVNIGAKFDQFRKEFNCENKLKEYRQKQITVIDQEDSRCPLPLKKIADPPICLYIKGNINQYNFEKEFFLAVVGTRKPTAYGEQMARKFSFDLAQAGFIIVSGMALGIDAIAHQAALDAYGRTIAILGCGVDIIYPQANYQLYQQIINRGGLIMSEFPPGHTVLKGLFVARNRLISGISMGVLVVEGAKDSGALITAKYAADQGKEVFAPPGPLTSQMSEAPHILLKQGAKLVTSVNDILEEFNIRMVPKEKEDIKKELNSEEKIIFDLLVSEPKIADDLATITKFTIEKILNLLSVMEIKRIVEKNSEGRYQVR